MTQYTDTYFAAPKCGYSGKSILEWNRRLGMMNVTVETTPRIPVAPFYLHGLTLIPAWISNYMPGKVWDEITYPFLNFNGATVEV